MSTFQYKNLIIQVNFFHFPFFFKLMYFRHNLFFIHDFLFFLNLSISLLTNINSFTLFIYNLSYLYRKLNVRAF